MKGMLGKCRAAALAVACACSAASMAAPVRTAWFSGAAEDGGLTATNADWNEEELPEGSVEVSGEVISFDMGANEVLTLTHTAPAPDTNTITVVTAKDVVFTPCAYDDLDDDDPDGAQAVLTAAYYGVETNYYAYVNNSWVKLDGAEPGSAPVEVSFEMNYYDNGNRTAAFKINGDYLYNGSTTNFLNDSGKHQVEGVACTGSGSLKSIGVDVEIAPSATVSAPKFAWGADYATADVTFNVTEPGDYKLTVDGRTYTANAVGGKVTFEGVETGHKTAYDSFEYAITSDDVRISGSTSGTEVIATSTGLFSTYVENGVVATTGGVWAAEYRPTVIEDDKLKFSVESGKSEDFTLDEPAYGDFVTVVMKDVCFGDAAVTAEVGTDFAGIKMVADANSGTGYSFSVLTKTNSAPEWAVASGFAPAEEGEYDVTVVFNYTNQTYMVAVEGIALSVGGSTEFAFAKDKKCLEAVSVGGIGSIASIKGIQSEGNMVIDAAGNKFATTEAAVAAVLAGKATEPLTMLHDGTAPEGWKIEDGKLVPDVTYVAEIVDGGKFKTLAAAVAAAADGSTVKLLADDAVSFADVEVTDGVPSNGSIVIDKNLTIDGAGFTVYGNTNAEISNVTDLNPPPGGDLLVDDVNGSNVCGFFVKSGNVTFTNITLTTFGDTAYLNKFGYTPIQTASAYTGTLALADVNFNKFNRQAVCVRGGALTINGGTYNGNSDLKGAGSDYFQQPIEVRGGAVATITDVTIRGGGSNQSYPAGGIVVFNGASATVVDADIDFDGYGIWADNQNQENPVVVRGNNTTVTGSDAAVFVEDGSALAIEAGSFTGNLIRSSSSDKISITGGTYSTDPSAYVASGYKATESAGVWTVTEVTGIDPTDPTSTQDVTVTAEDIEAAGSAEAAAIANATVVIPDAVETACTTLTPEAYKAYFTFSATSADEGVYTVAITGFAEGLVTDVDESALAAMQAAVADGEATNFAVAVPAGLYYKIETFDTLGGVAVDTEKGLSATGTTVAVDKPTSTTQGFIKVQLGAKAFE